MATHTTTYAWGANEVSTSLTDGYYRFYQTSSVYTDLANYTITKLTFSIDWHTSLNSTPGDLYICLANSKSDAMTDEHIWRSSVHQSYGSYKTFVTDIPVDKFLQVKNTHEYIVAYFHSTVLRKFYFRNPKLSVTYTIPDITYTYKDWNGKILKKETLEKGTTPTPPPDPTKADDDKYSYTFAGWTIYDESTSNVTYVAEYDQHIHKYTITISTDGNGKITNRNGTEAVSHKVNYGSVPELTAVPNDGYRFLKWHDGNTENPRKFPAVTSDITIMALFEPTGETEFSAYLGTSSNKITGRLGTTEAQGYIGTTRVF